MDGTGGGGEPEQRSGCLVALYTLFGVGLLLLLGTAGALYLASRSETGQRVLGVAREGASLLVNSQRAPGTDALREYGCETAMVVETADILATIEAFEDLEASDAPEAEETPEFSAVICVLPLLSDVELDCAEIARRYGGAVADPPETFIVTGEAQGVALRSCRGLYAPDGSLVDDLEEAEASAAD